MDVEVECDAVLVLAAPSRLIGDKIAFDADTLAVAELREYACRVVAQLRLYENVGIDARSQRRLAVMAVGERDSLEKQRFHPGGYQCVERADHLDLLRRGVQSGGEQQSVARGANAFGPTIEMAAARKFRAEQRQHAVVLRCR